MSICVESATSRSEAPARLREEAAARGASLPRSIGEFHRDGAQRLTHYLQSACGGLAVGLGFAIPISTTLTEVLTAALCACWLLSGRYGAKYRAIRGNPVLLFSLAMFAVFAFGVIHSTAPLGEALSGLLRYRKLLYIPILATVFAHQRARQNGVRAFQLAMLVTLAASFLMWVGWVETKWGSPDDCAVFKNHINQNVLMAFFIGLLAVTLPSRGAGRWWWAAIIALAVFNVLFMVQGRTGYLILFGILALLMYQWSGLRGLAAGVVVAAAAGMAAYGASANFRHRVDLAAAEAADYFRDGRDTPDSSIGERLLFYRIALHVIGRDPLRGGGTGSFRVERERFTEGREFFAAPNPHSGYLSIAVQTGLVGLGVFLAWVLVQWRLAARLPGAWSPLAQVMIVTFVVGSLFNSFLSTTTEAHLFAYFTAMCFGAFPCPDSARPRHESHDRGAADGSQALQDTLRIDTPTAA
jgi:O-antigen ligase